MRLPQDTSKRDNALIVTCVVVVVGLFFCMQKYENARFHKDVSPKLFSQNVKTPSARQMAAVEE